MAGRRTGSAGGSPFGLRLLGTACILAVPHMVAAQQAATDSGRSTRAGIYTAEQASRGSEVYALSCVSCHSAATHTGPAFAAKWNGLTLADLFEYIRESMPKNDPGTLSTREYLLAMIYLLQMNGMPPGSDSLPSDLVALNQVRIDFKLSRDSTPNR